jgi:hypothetical protein
MVYQRHAITIDRDPVHVLRQIFHVDEYRQCVCRQRPNSLCRLCCHRFSKNIRAPPRGTKERRAGSLAVGVIGRELPEKNTDQLLNLLIGWRVSGELSAEIILGSNDTRVLETWARRV